MNCKRRQVVCEHLENRRLLTTDTANLGAPIPSAITTDAATDQPIVVIYFGSTVDVSTFGDANLRIIGPDTFPGTITYVEQGTVDPSLVGLEKVAIYNLHEAVPASENGNTYTVSVAPNQVNDGQGGTFPTQSLATFQIQIPIATTPPITLVNADGTVVASGSNIDFGKAVLSTDQQPINKTLGIRNNGSAPITVTLDIDEAFGFGGSPFTFTSQLTNPIQPGQTGEFTVALNVHILSLNTGVLTAPLNITVADPSPYIGYTPQSLDLTADIANPVTPPITLVDSGGTALTSGSNIVFGTAELSADQQPISKTIGIRNDDDVPITVTLGIDEASGMGGSPFTFTSPLTNPIQPGQTGVFTVTLDVHILTLSTGELIAPLSITVADASPSIGYTPESLNLIAEIVNASPRIVRTIDVTARKPGVFTDADGSNVIVRLAGAGTATLGFGSTGDADLKDLTTNGTTMGSSLTITPIGGSDGRTRITGNVTITGSLGRFIAPKVDLISGDLTRGDEFQTNLAVGALTLGDVIGLEQMNVYGYLNTPLRFTAGNVQDMTFSTGQPVASLRVKSWTDTHAFDATFLDSDQTEQVVVPSIAALTCAGDFTVGVNEFVPRALNHLSIGGTLGADPWVIDGAINSLRVGAIPSTFSASIGGTLKQLIVSHDDAGVVAAGLFGTVQIDGNLSGAKILAGVNLGSDGTLGGDSTRQDMYSAGSIDALRVTGSATNAFVSCGFQATDALFDSSSGTEIGGTLKSLVVHGGMNASSNVIAEHVKSARLPDRVDPTTDGRFVIIAAGQTFSA